MGNAELIQPTRIPFSTSAIDAVSTTTCRRYRAGCLRRVPGLDSLNFSSSCQVIFTYG